MKSIPSCDAVDEVTGAVCNKPYDKDELSHIIHRCVDDGIEFIWKTPAVTFGDLEVVTYW